MYASDDLYTLRQAAAFLSVSEIDIRRMVLGGDLRAWSMPNSKTMLVRKRDLLPFLDPARNCRWPASCRCLATNGNTARPKYAPA